LGSRLFQRCNLAACEAINIGAQLNQPLPRLDLKVVSEVNLLGDATRCVVRNLLNDLKRATQPCKGSQCSASQIMWCKWAAFQPVHVAWFTFLDLSASITQLSFSLRLILLRKPKHVADSLA